MDRRRFLRNLSLVPIAPLALKGMDWSTPSAEALPVNETATDAFGIPPTPATIPPGTILPFVGEAPEGWLPCDGRPEYIKTYPALAAAIGTTYGADGNGTFKLPDLRANTVAVSTAGSHNHSITPSPVPPNYTHDSYARADHNHSIQFAFQQFCYMIKT